MEMPGLAQPFKEVIKEFFTYFNILSILVALNDMCLTDIFFSGMGGMYKAGHTFTSDSRR